MLADVLTSAAVVVDHGFTTTLLITRSMLDDLLPVYLAANDPIQLLIILDPSCQYITKSTVRQNSHHIILSVSLDPDQYRYQSK
jgi:hypothetical protein